MYKQREMGEGGTFKLWKKIRVICEKCGTAMVASSLCHHMETSHGIVIPQTQGWNLKEG